MIDHRMRRLIDPPLNHAGRALAGMGVSADGVTLLGLGFGLAAALAVAVGAGSAGIAALIALSRLADGLDGAVARVRGKTDFGGFLDIVADFAFYGAIPLAFAVRDAANALPAAALLFSFYLNGGAFLAFAALAAKRGIETAAQGQKSFFYLSGLMEGTETVAFFLAMGAFPAAFAPLAWIFAALTLVSALARILSVRAVLDENP